MGVRMRRADSSRRASLMAPCCTSPQHVGVGLAAELVVPAATMRRTRSASGWYSTPQGMRG